MDVLNISREQDDGYNQDCLCLLSGRLYQPNVIMWDAHLEAQQIKCEYILSVNPLD